MISKQEKLQYGEILRIQVFMLLMQMREKQERKRLEQLEKRGPIRQPPPPTQPPQYYQQAPQAYQPQPPVSFSAPSPDFNHKQNNYNPSPLIDKKEMLQRKLQMQQYNPFGKVGSGAPMRDHRGEIVTNRKQTTSQPNSTANYPNSNYAYQQHNTAPNSNMYNGGPQYPSQQMIPPSNTQSMQESAPYGYSQQIPQQQPQGVMYSQPPQQYAQRPPPQDSPYQPSFVPPPVQQEYRPGQDMPVPHKQGGRNLLQLENVGMAEINLKQRQKIEYQKVLQQQMEEVANKKKLELEQKQKQDERIEQANKRFIEEERKQAQEQKKKKKLAEDQVREAADRARQQAEQNKKKKLIDMPPIKVPDPIQPQVSNKQTERPAPSQHVPSENINVQRNYASREPASNCEGGQQDEQPDYKDIQGAFNTQVSREFIRREKQKDPERKNRDKHLQQIKSQLVQLKDEVEVQVRDTQYEIQRVRLEAERNKIQKQQMDRQLNMVKEELRRKMQSDNQRLHDALIRNDPDNYVPQSKAIAEPRAYQPRREPTPVEPLKAAGYQKMVEKTYYANDNLGMSNASNNFEAGLNSLVAETKKIPVLLKNNDKLTMSHIQDFAVDSRFFHKRSSNNVTKKRAEVIHETEQDQNNNAVPKDFSNKYDPKTKGRTVDPFANEFDEGDELDRFVKKQGQDIGKWSKNMGSVDSQVGREIQMLLKEQRRVPSRGREEQQNRPMSKLSNAGMSSLAINDKYGYGAEEFTLKSQQPGTLRGYGTRNSFDLNHYNNINDRRLEKLKQLGVSTVNGDDQLNRLDVMLNKYN